MIADTDLYDCFRKLKARRGDELEILSREFDPVFIIENKTKGNKFFLHKYRLNANTNPVPDIQPDQH